MVIAGLAAGCREEAPRAPDTLGAPPRPAAPRHEVREEAPRADVATTPEVQGASAAPEPEPLVVTELPELCRQACANALRLVLGELPEGTAPAMRLELRQAMERECPGRCLQRASLESARCSASAKSALELAACQ